jgi:putative Mg2+ transporter-C (MgtC) family protein
MDIVLGDVYIQLFLAMALGMILGIERFVAHKTAGMRTYTLISMGSALFVIISQLVVAQISTSMFDPLRVAAQVVAAAGFLGVGAIFRTDQGVSGVTTASGMWVAAGIGMACGFGLFHLAVTVTGLTLFTFIVLWFIEKQIRKIPIREKEGPSL